MRYVMTGDLATEEIGDELLLCDPAGSAVHRLSGDGRRYFESVSNGPAELPDDDVTAALVASGAIAPMETGVSRRKAIAMGAATVAAVGVVTVGLPNAAAAQSPGPSPAPEEPFENPTAPTEGTAPLADSFAGATTSGVGATQTTRSLWRQEDLVTPVTFSWNLYSPAGSTTGVLVGSGVSTGTTPSISISGIPPSGQSFRWILVPFGGGTPRTILGTFVF